MEKPVVDNENSRSEDYWESAPSWYNEANVTGQVFCPGSGYAFFIRRSTISNCLRWVMTLSLMTGLIFYISWSSPSEPVYEAKPDQLSLYKQVIKLCVKNRMMIYENDPDERYIAIDTSLVGHRIIVSIYIGDKDSILMFECPFPGMLHEKDLAFLSLSFMEKNCEYTFGNFQIDTLERLLYFRNTVDLRATGLNDSIFLKEFSYPMREIMNIIPFVLKKDGIIVADTNNDSEEEVS